jgi:hypothetical protein
MPLVHRNGAPVPWDMPEIKGPADLPAVHIALLQAVADGVLAPSDARQISALVEDLARSYERKGAATPIHHTFGIRFVDPANRVESEPSDTSEEGDHADRVDKAA